MAMNDFQLKIVAQRNAADCIIVDACPGSGKTYTVENLVAALLNDGQRIGLFTFSRKAAEDMRVRIAERIFNKLGDTPLSDDEKQFFKDPFSIKMGQDWIERDPARRMLADWTCTIHALSKRLLKTAGLKPRVLSGKNAWEIKGLIKDKAKEIGYSEGWKPIEYYFHLATDALIDPKKVEGFYNEILQDVSNGSWHASCLAKLYLLYTDYCRERNLVDFSMMQAKVIKLIRTDPGFKEKISDLFDFVIIDEAQDTSDLQMEIIDALLGEGARLILVGDVDQCVIAETEITCYNKTMLAKDISSGDKIIVGCGNRKTVEVEVENIYKREVMDAPVITIITESGKELTTTPEHIYFAEHIIEDRKPEYFTYLMYKEGLGYRVGITSAYRKLDKKRSDVGYKQRLRAERADAIWVLARCDTRADAQFLEQLYSVKYGLPTWTFHTQGRKVTYDKKKIRELYNLVDTEQNARKLLADLWMKIEYPHHVPRAVSKKRRRNFTITLCADSRQNLKKPLHKYYISGSNQEDGKKLENIGLNIRNAKNVRGWRIENMTQNLGKIYDILGKIRDTGINPVVKEQAHLTNNSLAYTPASHILPGMIVFTLDGKKVIEEHVAEVKRHFYTGFIYDFDVPPFHNFSANGIMIHNSMYAFRGAVPEVLHNKEGTRFILPINYRSTRNIIDTAAGLIKSNYASMPDLLKPFEPRPDVLDGEPIEFMSCQTVEELGNQIALTMQTENYQPGDIFILSRTRAECALLHTELLKAGIPAINKSGGLLFGAPHIRKVLAYAQLACDFEGARDNLEILNEIANVATKHFLSPITRRNHKPGCDNQKSWIDCGCPIIQQEGIDHSSARYYGKKSIEKAGDWSGIINQVFETNKGGYPTMASKGALDLTAFVSRIERRKSLADVALLYIIEECVLPWMLAEEGVFDTDPGENGQLEDFDVLLAIVDNPDQTLEQYLNMVQMLTDDNPTKEEDSVLLGTFHWSKGAERPVVFVNATRCPIVPPKAAEGRLPTGKPATMEEERRLVYVGLTRAKKKAYVAFAQQWNNMPVDLELVGEIREVLK